MDHILLHSKLAMSRGGIFLDGLVSHVHCSDL